MLTQILLYFQSTPILKVKFLEELSFFTHLGSQKRVALRDGLPQKIAVLLDFVQMRGGEGPAQIFCPLFTNCIYWVNLGMGREGETPAQFFWHIGVQKKWYKLSKLGGGGRVVDRPTQLFYIWIFICCVNTQI